MGGWDRTLSIKMDDETWAKLDALNGVLLCAAGNRSHTVRTIINVAHSILLGQRTVNERRDAMQDLLSTIQHYRVRPGRTA